MWAEASDVLQSLHDLYRMTVGVLNPCDEQPVEPY